MKFEVNDIELMFGSQREFFQTACRFVNNKTGTSIPE